MVSAERSVSPPAVVDHSSRVFLYSGLSNVMLSAVITAVECSVSLFLVESIVELSCMNRATEASLAILLLQHTLRSSC